MIARRPGEPDRKVVAWGRGKPMWPRCLEVVPITPRNRRIFWDLVVAGHLRRWEQLDSAIIGVGRIADGPLVTVYSYARARQAILKTMSPSERRWAEIDDFIQNTVGRTNLGPLTPYFTHVEM